jgi:radical SAM superfamily enzyme YgiQ (UPF0313 family)
MKILLVHLSGYTIVSVGLRTISACLKGRGHQVTILFIPFHKGGYEKFQFKEEEVNKLAKNITDFVAKGSFDLVGFSLTTNFFTPAAIISDAIKKENPKLPIIWGGVHPTVLPEMCLKHADMVCLGEGEEAMLELVENMESGKAYFNTKNICLKNGSNIIKNDVRNFIEDLNTLPFQDFDINTHYIMKNKDIFKMTEELLYEYMPRWRTGASFGYLTMITRGCPYSCTYCFNDRFNTMYKGKGKIIRSRTIPNVIAELKEVLGRYNKFDTINFADDAFLFNTNISWYEEFCSSYKKNINLPFSCISDLAQVRGESFRLLVDAGLYSIQIGIQSGSEKTLKLFNRHTNKQFIFDRIGVINKFKTKLMPTYDVILDNPYDSEQDLIDTMEFLIKIPKPFRLQLFSLTFFPGTPLYERAVKDGLIDRGDKNIYIKNDSSFNSQVYFNQLIFLIPLLSERQLRFLLTHRNIFFKAMLAVIFRLWENRSVLISFPGYKLARKMLENIYRVYVHVKWKVQAETIKEVV